MTYTHYIKKLLNEEKERQNNEISLIASENYASDDVLAACGSCIQNKYAEGYPGRRYYGGCEIVDKIESITRELVCKVFNTKYSNVQSHSGSSANLAVYLAATKYFKCKPTDLTIISHSLNSGAHLTHGSIASITGSWFNTYTFESDNGLFNYSELKNSLDKVAGPVVLVIGFSAYPRELRYDMISSIVKTSNKNIIVLCDISHIAGLIAVGEHQHPLDYDWGKAHVIITSTTHKTLRGARHAIITTNDEEMAKLVDKSVFPGLNGGPLQNMISAVGIAMDEVLRPQFRDYIRNVLSNVRAMVEVFNSRGIDMVSGGSDNHLILLDLKRYNKSGKEVEDKLTSLGIITNKNAVPFDKRPKSETSGLRIGTAAVTTRGFNESDCKVLANIIADVVLGNMKEDTYYTDIVNDMVKKHPLWEGLTNK